jgi:hypothetical protein
VSFWLRTILYALMGKGRAVSMPLAPHLRQGDWGDGRHMSVGKSPSGGADRQQTSPKMRGSTLALTSGRNCRPMARDSMTLTGASCGPNWHSLCSFGSAHSPAVPARGWTTARAMLVRWLHIN